MILSYPFSAKINPPGWYWFRS